MESVVLEQAIAQGLWAVLFVVMLFYVLRQNDKREDEYQEIIDNITSKFCIIEEVQRDVSEIKERMFK